MDDIEVHFVAPASLDWLTNNKSRLNLLPIFDSFLCFLGCHEVREVKPLVFRILYHESCLDWALIFD